MHCPKINNCHQFLFFFTALLFAVAGKTNSVNAQTLYFPPLSANNWDTLSASQFGWCTAEIDSLYDFLDSTNTKGFVVLKDGKIVLEQYFDNFTVDSLWYWASAGKSLTACLVGIAQQEGLLSIDDTTSGYLGAGWTSCTPSEEEKITIRNQISMTSGLDDQVADPYCTIDTCLIYKADAGTRWAYHNAPYTLLDGVLQNATGVNLNNYVFQKLTLTTGISGLFVPSGFNNVFVSNTRTMARFGLMILAGGFWNGNAILTDSSYFNAMVNTSQSLNNSYGYLWWLNGKSSFMVPGLQLVFPGPLFPNAPADMVSALGKNGQIISVIPSQNLVVVRAGDAPGTGEVPLTYVIQIWNYLNKVICNTTGTTPEVTNLSSVKIIGNPVSEMLELRAEGIAPDQIQIYSVSGKLIYSGVFHSTLSLVNTTPGLYFLRYIYSDHVKTDKFIKK